MEGNGKHASTAPEPTMTQPWAGLLPFLIIAPIIGSFLGTLILRTARGEPFVAGRSHCDACGHRLTPAELIPIASYLAQRGRCRACRTPIAPFHWHIELAAVLIPLTAWLAGQEGPALMASCLLGWTLLALAWIDALTMRLPDFLTLPLILAGLAECLWLDPEDLTDRALGAALGYTIFRLLAWTYRKLRHRDGLGEGDAKLLAAAGAWAGASMLADVVLAAALSGLAFAATIRLRGAPVDASTRLAFGPFLAAAIWLVWLAR